MVVNLKVDDRLSVYPLDSWFWRAGCLPFPANIQKMALSGFQFCVSFFREEIMDNLGRNLGTLSLSSFFALSSSSLQEMEI